MTTTAALAGTALPNIPWEGEPAGNTRHVWRYSANPIIPRDATPMSNSVFNSAAVAYEGKFAGVFRCDDRSRHMNVHAGRSEDGIHWQIEPKPIEWIIDDPEVAKPEYLYDPRVVHIDDRYWVTWCNGFHGPTIGMGYTRDFRSFHLLENALLPYNRNGVLFPRRVGGNYLLLSRPSDTGHTAFGDIFISQSEDMVHWGRHRWVMGPKQGWESTKIGAGPIPIETTEGWLLIYHGVLTSCNGYVYSFGVALLDLEKPWKVIKRGRPYLLSPQESYECWGDVPNVTFPCAALTDAPTGRITIYYGCADTTTGLVFTTVDRLMAFLNEFGS